MYTLLPYGLWISYIAFAGACVGSFLNVVIARLPAGESIVHPRSRCPRCMSAIAWYDNIPVLSYLLLRARCRGCSLSISARYPMVELLTSALMVAVWMRLGWTWQLLLWWPLVGALLAIAFLDIDHWWVPDVITFPAMLWVAVAAFLPDGIGWFVALMGVIPALGLWLLAFLFERITGREGMGLGDVKLLALLGLALGPMEALNVLVLASMQGAVIGIVVILTGGHEKASTCDDSGAATGDESKPAESAVAEDDDKPAPAEADERAATAEDDAWEPPLHAIPFGPFLVLACLEVLLLPDVFANLFARLSVTLADLMVTIP